MAISKKLKAEYTFIAELNIHIFNDVLDFLCVKIEDKRTFRKPKFSLRFLLAAYLLAQRADCHSSYKIEKFVRDHRAFFRKNFDMPRECPSHDTFNRMLTNVVTPNTALFVEVSPLLNLCWYSDNAATAAAAAAAKSSILK